MREVSYVDLNQGLDSINTLLGMSMKEILRRILNQDKGSLFLQMETII